MVVGHRYGFLVPGRDQSFSEAEYSEGHHLGKPCLVYMRSDDVPILPKYVERNPDNLRRLENWKALLNQRHTVSKFSDAHDLALQVSADISRTVQSIQEAEQEAHVSNNGQTSYSSMDELLDLFRGAIEQGVSEDRVLSAMRRTVTSLLAEEGVRPPTIFLSYSHEDKEIVSKVANELKNAGLNVWFDLSEIKLGDSLQKTINRGLDSADYLAFFMSSSSMKKAWPRAELNAVISRELSGNRGAMVLPVLLDETDIPPVLRDKRYLDLRDKDVKGKAKELIDAIRHHMKNRQQDDE